MANIKVTEEGWEAEIDIPGDDDIMDYLRREYMIAECVVVQRDTSTQAKVEVLDALIAAIREHFLGLPVVEVGEE